MPGAWDRRRLDDVLRRAAAWLEAHGRHGRGEGGDIGGCASFNGESS